MQTNATLTKKQRRCFKLFQAVWLVYFLAIIGSLTLIKIYHSLLFFPLATGIVLGSIYFAVAGYTFYDLYLSTDHQSNRAGVEQVSLGKMVSWLMPVSVMVLFVSICFMLIYDLPVNDKVNRGIYFSHPFYLGSLYKQAHAQSSKPKTAKEIKPLIDKAHGLHFFASQKHASFVFNPDHSNALLPPHLQAECLAHLHKIPFGIAFSFSFVGVLLFTLRDVVSRFKTKDLYPKTFIGYQIRFILAISLAVGVANYYMADWPTKFAPLLFMGIGMFPVRTLRILEKKGRAMMRYTDEERKSLPLTSIQGMTHYYYERFQENNITDVQNLAQSDLVFLRKNMSCGSRILADFVAQAILINLFQSEDTRQKLKIRGVHDIISLRDTALTGEPTLLTILDLNQDEIMALLETESLRSRIHLLSQMKQKSDSRDTQQFLREKAT